MSANAFQPNGDTVAIDGSSTASDAVQCNNPQNNATQRLIQNTGTSAKKAWLAWGGSTIEAEIPEDGTPANGIPIAAGAVLVLTFPPNAYFSVICGGSDETVIELTPGEGN